MEMTLPRKSFKHIGANGLRNPLLALGFSAALVGCTGTQALDLAPQETFVQGYVIDEQTLALAPVGSSRAQVELALGTPTTVNNYAGNDVYYYISQTRRRGAQFLKARLVSQRILAVYFNEEDTVTQIADYGLQDGQVFDFITRTTPTSGVDQTFLTQILTGTLGGGAPSLGR
jgi:outer membrane protein assembly factor BamE (lipoprotein component of BamABCDE complex)